MMPEFDTVSEFILYVEDMDRMYAFYTEVLGLEATAGEPEHGFVKFGTSTCDLCLHGGGEGDIGADAPQFTFAVDDLGGARYHLVANGVGTSEVRNPAPDTYVFDALDPEGNSFAVESSSPPV